MLVQVQMQHLVTEQFVGLQLQITGVIAGAVSGAVLAPQLVFAGKTAASLPEVRAMPKFAKWHFTFTDNHWSTLETTKDWVNCIFVPYVNKVRLTSVSNPKICS
jgi:hypothetical protein